MKKKIKDITIEDAIMVCNKQIACFGCPLVNICAEMPVHIKEQKEELEKKIKL